MNNALSTDVQPVQKINNGMGASVPQGNSAPTEDASIKKVSKFLNRMLISNNKNDVFLRMKHQSW